MNRLPLLRFVIVGFGAVGRAFARLVLEKADFLEENYGMRCGFAAVVDIGGAAVTEKGNLPVEALLDYVQSGGNVETFPGYGQPGLDACACIRQVRADFMVETTPTNLEDGEPARSHILQALRSGHHVLSANKGPFVWHHREIVETAEAHGRKIGLGAATAAALPALDLGEICLAGTNILRVEGILNGTSNYILSRMHQEGCSYEEALRDAQSMGIAETDPRLDVEGWDTANKLVLIANRIFRSDLTLRDVDVRGMTHISLEEIQTAKAEGSVIKLIGRIDPTSTPPRITVGCETLPANHPLAGIEGAEKAVSYDTDSMGRVTVFGGRSSPKGAAAALLKDAIRIACHQARSFSKSSKRSSR